MLFVVPKLPPSIFLWVSGLSEQLLLQGTWLYAVCFSGVVFHVYQESVANQYTENDYRSILLQLEIGHTRQNRVLHSFVTWNNITGMSCLMLLNMGYVIPIDYFLR